MRKGQRTDDSAETRQRLLEAGLTALREEPIDRVFEKLQARPIASRAGLTTGAFYHHFDGSDSFIEALLYLALERPNPEVEVGRAAFERAATSGGTFPDAALAAAEAVIRFQHTDTTFSLMLAVASKAPGNPQLVARLKEMYGIVEAAAADFYDGLFPLTGRELRPPFTRGDLAGTIIALYEGLGLRQNVDPDAVPADRFGLLVLAVIGLMTRPLGDTGGVSEWLEANAPQWLPGT